MTVPIDQRIITCDASFKGALLDTNNPLKTTGEIQAQLQCASDETVLFKIEHFKTTNQEVLVIKKENFQSTRKRTFFHFFVSYK